IGADADIAIYNMNPELVDPSKEPKAVRRAFGNTAYTIKNGEIVAKDAKITKPVQGKTFRVNPQLSSPTAVADDMKRRFREYWTIEYENYSIQESYLANSVPISVKTEV
ncbi:MAG: formylmethanofuran dehydrogenase subunit A, partial [Candidatus Bathyarchaeota archaeon]